MQSYLIIFSSPLFYQDLRFLNAGGSVYPLDALMLAGVDLTTPKVVEEIFDVLGDYVDRLETLLFR